jgi:hypothetical protein
LTELDIGDNALALRVESSNLGHSQTDLFYDTIEGIVLVFDCDSPEDSVLPSEDMIHDNGSEVRTMLGYFGDPAGGHTVTFMFDFVDRWDDDYENVASIVNYGRYSITAEFDVSEARCDATNGDCRVPYGLTVWVDGVELCSNSHFGDITNYDQSLFP